MKLTILRKLSFTDWIGGALALLGMAELVANMAGFAPESDELSMSFSAALCFMLSGGALLAQSFHEFWCRRLQTAFGSAILLLAVLGGLGKNLSQILLHKDPFPYAPELSLDAALVFILTGLILVLMHRIRAKWAGSLLQLLSAILILIGILSIIDNILGLNILHDWYQYQDTPTITSVGIFIIGIGLSALMERMDWYEKLGLNRENRKITMVSAILLSTVAFSCGLIIFATMARQTEEAFKKSLVIDLESRIRLFQNALDNAIDDAIFNSRRQRLNALMDKASAGTDTAEERKAIEDIADRIMSLGHVSAITIHDAAGKKITQRGKFTTDATFKFILPVKQKATLLWRNGFVLNVKIDNIESDKHVASLNIDMPLPKIDALYNELNGLGKTGAMAVCAPDDAQYMSCPLTRSRSQKRQVPRYIQGELSPMARAVAGKAGVVSMMGQRGTEIVSAYAPIGSLGLGMTVRLEKTEIYQPIRTRFEHTLLWLLILVAVGVVVLHWQISPLVSKLINEIDGRKRAEEESRLLQTISGAVGGAKDIHAALEIVLRKVCEATGWKLGQAWVPRFDGTVLECSPAWYTSIAGAGKFRLSNEGLTFAPGQGMPGRVWVSKQPEWMRDVTVSRNRARMFIGAGLKVGTGIPILAGKELVAVIEFFTSELHQEDGRLAALIFSVAAQLGIVIQRERAQTALDATEERYRAIIENSVEAIYLYDLETKQVLHANSAFLNLLGYKPEDLGKISMSDFINHDKKSIDVFARRAVESGKGFGIGERQWRRRDGTLRYMQVTVGRVQQKDGVIGFAIARDVTEEKGARERLAYLAHYDELTGLPNRILFNDRLKQAMIEAAARERLVALMFVDLDRFKTINDTLGHEAGDVLLKAVAERLKDCVRRGDSVARLGGDEFTLVLADMAHINDASRMAQKILDSFTVPFRIGERDLFITPSIGITLYPFDQADANTLLKNADAAMYRAKEQGRNNYQFYTSEMNVRALERLSFETNLRQALERDEFILHYQPQVDLTTGTIIGMEALLRWQNPELGLVSPAEFIPIAEETGLIVSIGEWVIRTACRQNKAWQAAGLPPLRVSVNLSARQFKEKNLVERVAQVLNETGLEARYLELELTESLLQNPEATITPLKDLHALGVHLSIDDFGTGYSSLSYLKRFPIDTIKIDRSFVRDITTDADDAAIANAIITMAHSLGMHVVAEGVETAEQLAFLCQRQCDSMQGYYFSKPLPANVFAGLIKDGRRLIPSQRRISAELKVMSA